MGCLAAPQGHVRQVLYLESSSWAAMDLYVSNSVHSFELQPYSFELRGGQVLERATVTNSLALVVALAGKGCALGAQSALLLMPWKVADY